MDRETTADRLNQIRIDDRAGLGSRKGSSRRNFFTKRHFLRTFAEFHESVDVCRLAIERTRFLMNGGARVAVVAVAAVGNRRQGQTLASSAAPAARNENIADGMPL
jgi:hypothetical protein